MGMLKINNHLLNGNIIFDVAIINVLHDTVKYQSIKRQCKNSVKALIIVMN